MSDACSGALSNPGLAPPPPPPPPAAGQVPALRISTASELGPRRAAGPQEAYEPPAAIQNAMMTKDKKPFTYTPGMGGKLDLSQIRSPRMARRVAKNANDEGIDGPPKVLDQQPDGPALAQPSLYYQPQVAVAVFPQGQQPTLQLRNSCLPRNPLAAGGEQQAARPTVRLECSPPQQQQQQQTPTPPMSPTQVTLAKAPTPWMQKQAQRPQQLPEWAKRGNANRSQDSSSGSDSPQPRQQQPSVPLRIEDRPSVFTAINEPGHHQFVNSNPHHMSRWGNPVGQSAYQPPSQSAYIVPVQVQSCSAPHNNHGNANAASSLQPEPGPVQSQSFRVLQKITDTYPEQAEAEQLRKLQLTEDDRYLMNAFKEQVDGQQYLHQEEDPRYRGAAIPSRAFRYLQTMTDSADAPNAHSTSRPVNSAAKKPNRHSNTFEQVPLQPYIPASQQQVPEPKKYTGAAIPSRSFRILQQMTTPESIAIEVQAPDTRPDQQSAAILPGYPIPTLSCHALHPSHFQPNNSDSANSAEATQSHEHDGQREHHKDQDEEQTEDDSSDSSCDSESYLAYSTGLNPLGRQRENEQELASESEQEDSDSTDCQQVSQLDNDSSSSSTDKHQDNQSTSDDESNEERDDTAVIVNLPLRHESEKAPENVETCVDFTLRRVGSREVKTPTFVVTASDASDDPREQTTKEQCKQLLCVRNSSKEEMSDEDEDSGVTSDVSRVSDSECIQADNQAAVHRRLAKNKKYERTQTHSRLFRLLSDEQMRVPASSCPQITEARPKSLDCEALLGRNGQPSLQGNCYYETWKKSASSYSPPAQPQIYPRLNVLCPRTSSAKNIPRLLAIKTQPLQSCFTSSRANAPTIPSNIPKPIRLNRRC